MMELIDPICEAKVNPYLGKHVCVVLLDGTTIYGTLGGLKGEQLMLNSCFGGEAAATANAKQSQLKRKREKARTTAFGYPYGPYPYGGALALDLALIALLFAIPFFFI